MSVPRYRWQPTTAEIARRYALRPDEVVRFDHNTSPFETDWAAGVIAPMARHLNEYPGASYSDLRQAAGNFYGVDQDWIVPGAGVDEILLLIARAFLGPRTRACAAVPTYPLYEIATLQTGSEFMAIDFEPPSFEFPRRALGEAAETSDVTWLCVPNNPTGHRMSDAQVVEVLSAAKGLVVIDAAYAEFTGDRWGRWVTEFPQLIVCHTMSKAFGLAALRVGFAMTNPSVADQLDSVRPPGSVSSLSVTLAEQALNEPSRMHRHVARIVKERERLRQALIGTGIGVVPDTEANFLLCEVGGGAEEIAGDLMTEGLVVRSFPTDGPLGGFLRFTVRSPTENDRLLDALRRTLP